MFARVILSATFVAVASCASANAAPILTFDTAPSTYTAGATYSESGFSFTLSGGNPAHYGDGGGAVGTLHWHDGGNNDVGVIATLTQDNSLNFDFLQFTIQSLSGPLTVSAPGFTPQVFATPGTYAVNFLNVPSVSFSVVDGNQVAIDNVSLNAVVEPTVVPEPATLAVFGFGGLALAGYIRRRKTALAL